MHTGKEMPLINKDATMKEALLEMTAKMLGSVGIVDTDGKLIGMITDGDLRRCMSDNILSKNVAEIMTKNPKTTTPDILASELLKILNENKITQMFVIDNGMPVGIIHIHDCFNAGVA